MEEEKDPLEKAEELIVLGEAETDNLVAVGHFEKAQEIINSVKEKSGRKYYIQSRLFKAKSCYSEQLKSLKTAVRLEHDIELHKQYKQELTVLEESKELLEEIGSLDTAEELIGLGMLDAAQDSLNKNNTVSGRRYYLQSRIFKERKWYSEQRKFLKKAVKKEPDREDYKQELAELEEFAKTKEYKSAVRKHQMGETGNICRDVCCEGCCYALCGGICEGCNGC